MNWDTPLKSKWPYVQIESKHRLTRDEMISLVCQMDCSLSGWRHGGNGRFFNNWLWDVAGVPEEPDSVIPFHGHMMNAYASIETVVNTFGADGQEYYTDLLSEARGLMWDRYEKNVKDWQEKFHRFQESNGDGTVFDVDLFSSCYVGGPRAWFDWNTGKIGYVGTIGKWPEKLESVRPELEAFAKRYSDIPVKITFFEEDLTPITAILVQNGKCEEAQPSKFNKRLYKKKVWKTSPYNYMSKLEHFFLRAKLYFGKKMWDFYDFDNNTGEQFFDQKAAYLIIAMYKDQIDYGEEL